MAEQWLRAGASQPLFDDTVAQLAACCVVLATRANVCNAIAGSKIEKR
ncbi:MAG: hypothetical protein WA956_02855 [Stenotrophomonas sp.]